MLALADAILLARFVDPAEEPAPRTVAAGGLDALAAGLNADS